MKSQIIFCPPGAEWHHVFAGYNFSGPPLFLNEKIVYSRDTVIGTDTAKILYHRRYYNRCNFPQAALTCIKQNGDTVLMRSAATQNSWQILYNFALSAGQSWTANINTSYTPSTTLTHTVIVDSVKFTTANGFMLKTLHVKYKFPGSSPPETAIITERFGCSRFMFNYKNPTNYSDCELASGILCYQDSVFGLKQFTNYACDQQGYVSFNKNSFGHSLVKMYPNPTKDFFLLGLKSEFETENYILTIKDPSGREVKRLTLNNINLDSGMVNVADLAEGVYFVILSKNNSTVCAGKLIRSE